MLSSLAVVLEQPKRMSLDQLPLDKPAAADVTVETLWSGVSAGTERLLFNGQMPAFPGMGYPLVPGYESVGTVVGAGPACAGRVCARRGPHRRPWRPRAPASAARDRLGRRASGRMGSQQPSGGRRVRIRGDV